MLKGRAVSREDGSFQKLTWSILRRLLPHHGVFFFSSLVFASVAHSVGDQGAEEAAMGYDTKRREPFSSVLEAVSREIERLSFQRASLFGAAFETRLRIESGNVPCS